MKLEHENLLSIFAFNFNLRHCAGVPTLEEAETEALAALPMDQQQRLATAFVGFKVGLGVFLFFYSRSHVHRSPR